MFELLRGRKHNYNLSQRQSVDAPLTRFDPSEECPPVSVPHTRFAPQHTRITPPRPERETVTTKASLHLVPQEPARPSAEADLHSDAPIPVNILHMALPMRVAETQAKITDAFYQV
ncbi:MAG: hypothetical protein WBB25_08210 [Sulfitobacter sp.]